MIYVLGKDYEQFLRWCRENNTDRRSVVWIRDVFTLRGRKIGHKDRLIKYGPYWERSDWPELEDLLSKLWEEREDDQPSNPRNAPDKEREREAG